MTPEDDGDITIYPELAAVDEMECIGWQVEMRKGRWTALLKDRDFATSTARSVISTGRIRRVYAGAPIRITDTDNDTTEFP